MDKTRLAAEVERFVNARDEEQERARESNEVRRLDELELLLVGGGECNVCW